MKITGVRTKLYEYDMLRPLGDANSPQGRSRVASLAVFIETDECITGVSEVRPVPGAISTLWWRRSWSDATPEV